jgi:hypothetical protein
MKRKLLFFVTCFYSLCLSFNSYGQNQVYWREDFTTAAPAPFNADQAASSTVWTYNGTAGTWTMYGIWTTTGTDCPAAGQPTGTNRHIRSTGNTSLGTSTAGNDFDDTAFAITPDVAKGIRELHLYRARNNRRITVWKSADATVNSASYTGWTLVSVLPKSTGTAVCADTTILINDATAKRLMLKFERGGNSDVDSIVLTSELSLPVTFAGQNAYAVSAGVQVDWSIATETDMLSYDLQRSTNGRDFETIRSVLSKGNSVTLVKYTAIDNSPMSGINYYRIKGLGKDGDVTYTTILKVNLSKSKAEVLVAPNPVRNGDMNVQLSDLSKGTYSLKVFNNVGQVVFTSQLSTEGGSLTKSFKLPVTAKAGVYTLQVAGNDVNITKKIVVE